MFCYICWILLDGFPWDFYTRDSVDDTIEMRGNNPMLTSKLHVLLNFLTPSWLIFTRFYNRDSFDERIERKGNNPMLPSKLHVLLNISAPCWWIFIRLLLQGFFWWDYGKFLYLEDLLHHSLLPAFNLHTHTYIHIYIHVCMLMCLTTFFCAQYSHEINVHVIS